MCSIIIVDTNLLSTIVPKEGKEDNLDDILVSWIEEGHGILAYSDSGKYSEELKDEGKSWRWFRSLRQDQARLIRSDKLAQAKEALKLKGTPPDSDDTHILQLALASDALILCSEDTDLRGDFLNRDVLPNVAKRQRRSLYPYDKTRKQRDNFLRARRCPKRMKKSK